MGAIRIFEGSYLNNKQHHETTVDVSDEAMLKWFELLAYGYHLESKMLPEGGFRVMIVDVKLKHNLDQFECGMHSGFPSYLSEFLETTKVLS